MSDRLGDAIDAVSEDVCAVCGEPLGDTWTTRFNSTSGLQERIHLACKANAS